VRVTLVHNPGAGSGPGTDDMSEIVDAVRASGHAVQLAPCDQPDWQAMLDEPADVVAIIGGDGTVGRVAKRMIGKGVPLAVLAAGTANNIALTLGTEAIDAREQVESWACARRVAFDVAVARGPFGTEYLIEGLGCGLLVWGMRSAPDDSGRDLPRDARMARALAMLVEQSSAHPATRVEATLDGRDLSGDYLLLEAMNTQFIGPNLFLAPSGHPGDGLLDIVTVTSDARDMVREQLASWKRGALRPSEWPARQGRHLVLQWTGFPLHLDDTVWPRIGRPAPAGSMRIDVSMQGRALEFLVPPQTEHPPVP
jgi:diacylglycerol kinase (ATP)